MELCVGAGHAFVLGLQDGTASVYLSSGGGWIGGEGGAGVRAAAQQF